MIATFSQWAQGHPWAAVLALGVSTAMGLIVVYSLITGWREDRRRRAATRARLNLRDERSMPTATESYVAGAGAMSRAVREGTLRGLMIAWMSNARPVTEDRLDERVGFTRSQAVAFLHWANGQARVMKHLETGKPVHLITVVERGIECRWIRFREVPVVDGNACDAPEEAGMRS